MTTDRNQIVTDKDYFRVQLAKKTFEQEPRTEDKKKNLI